jgi:hypothetical protein
MEKKEKKYSYSIRTIASMLLLCVCLLLGVRSCELVKEASQSTIDLLKLQQDKLELKKTIDDKGREISNIQVVVLEKDKKIQEQLKEIKKLKSLDVKVILDTKTVYDTMTIALHDTTIITKTDTIKYQKFNFNDDWLILNGKVSDSKLIFDSLQVNNKYKIEIGDERVGLFKKEKKVYVINENPHTSTNDLQSFVLSDKKKWYQKDVWKIAGASLLTYFIVKP